METRDVSADLLTDHALGQDVVLHVLFEIFERDTLRLRRLLQIFHRVGMHLLAQLVQPLHHLGVGADAQVLRLLQQQLLVDQIAQQVFLVFFASCSAVAGSG